MRSVVEAGFPPCWGRLLLLPEGRCSLARDSAHFIRSGPSQCFLRPRYAGTCLLRAPPASRERGSSRPRQRAPSPPACRACALSVLRRRKDAGRLLGPFVAGISEIWPVLWRRKDSGGAPSPFVAEKCGAVKRGCLCFRNAIPVPACYWRSGRFDCSGRAERASWTRPRYLRETGKGDSSIGRRGSGEAGLP